MLFWADNQNVTVRLTQNCQTLALFAHDISAVMRNNDEMERWRLGEIERELLEIAARARMSTTDYAAALMAEVRRIERVVRKAQAN
jgi:hypothetical protein